MKLEKAVSLKYYSAVDRLLLDWLNGVLPHFQQYFSHITASAHIIHDFLHQYYAGALKCLAQGYAQEKNSVNPLRLEPRTPGLRVEHFTTELHTFIVSEVKL